MLNREATFSQDVGKLMGVIEVGQTQDLLENRSNDEFLKKSMGNTNFHLICNDDVDRQQKDLNRVENTLKMPLFSL